MSSRQSAGLSPVDMRDLYLTKHAQDVMRIEEMFVGLVVELKRMRSDLVGRVRLRAGDTDAMVELSDRPGQIRHRVYPGVWVA